MRSPNTLACVFSRRKWLPVVGLAALLLFPTWVRADAAVLFDANTLTDQAQKLYGSSGQEAVQDWFGSLDSAQGLAETAQLSVVNRFWNSAVRQAQDSEVWKQTDFWATPLDSLGKGLGDCEDFVIGKYFSLISLGVSPEKLRFIYVRAQVQGAAIAHMVLGYYATPTAEPLVLDSLIDAIKPARQRKDLTPVFSFNVQGIYVPGAKPASVNQIGRWRTLIQRMQRQGFTP
ncbi:MAG: transglutaminase [Pusillimonas sp.]|jgi:predicted transglutaminase-like cysteine proteinase|nr:transglutaminase [Pusillimonas sp.]